MKALAKDSLQKKIIPVSFTKFSVKQKLLSLLALPKNNCIIILTKCFRTVTL